MVEAPYKVLDQGTYITTTVGVLRGMQYSSYADHGGKAGALLRMQRGTCDLRHSQASFRTDSTLNPTPQNTKSAIYIWRFPKIRDTFFGAHSRD